MRCSPLTYGVIETEQEQKNRKWKHKNKIDNFTQRLTNRINQINWFTRGRSCGSHSGAFLFNSCGSFCDSFETELLAICCLLSFREQQYNNLWCWALLLVDTSSVTICILGVSSTPLEDVDAIQIICHSADSFLGTTTPGYWGRRLAEYYWN